MSIRSQVLPLAAVLLLAGNAWGQVIPGRYIVVLQDGADPSSVAASHRAVPSALYTHALRGFAASLPEAALEGLRRNPNVAWIEPDVMHHLAAQDVPTGIARSEYDAFLDGVSAVDVDIAILDTGIQLTHPDLNVVRGVDCRSLDRKTKDCKAGGNDDNGHGTHVAGSAAARDNGIGVVGTAPGARLHAVKVLDRNGSGTRSTIIQGLDWVTRNRAVIEVANLSIGGTGTDDTDGRDCSLTADAYHKAVCSAVNAGVTIVVAAGNERKDAATSVPAAYDEVITVSALADFDGLPGRLGTGSFGFSSCTEAVDDSFACFSNYGRDVDILAPGVGIRSTVPGSTYGVKSGTSMASPHVAGAAARIKAANPGYTPAQVKAELLLNANPAPCATASGACDDDPDGIQEPFLTAPPAL